VVGIIDFATIGKRLPGPSEKLNIYFVFIGYSIPAPRCEFHDVRRWLNLVTCDIACLVSTKLEFYSTCGLQIVDRYATSRSRSLRDVRSCRHLVNCDQYPYSDYDIKFNSRGILKQMLSRKTPETCCAGWKSVRLCVEFAM
jgi:hypothetical protein